MYAVSEAFHAAVKNGKDQKALLIFEDCVFTDEDINVDGGIDFNDNFNMEEDLAIGQANSNEISFSLFNDARLLNEYAFGEFLATLGVNISEASYLMSGNCSIQTANATWVGKNTSPRLTRNGSAVANPPGWAVKSLLAYNGKLWAFSGDGDFAVYNESTGARLPNARYDDQGQLIADGEKLNDFMKAKSKGWNGKGFYYDKAGRMLYIRKGGTESVYEFCPLGYFIAERPKAPDRIEISMTCYDRMQKLDEDMPGDAELGISYPISFAALLQKIGQKAGVPVSDEAFINSTAQLQRRPDEFDTATMRDVVKWIAEAACSNARFNRDGVLEMAWIRATGQSYTASDYMEFNPAWYRTKQITKLWNRDTQGSDRTVGTGDEAYLIQDNPLLRGVS